MSERDEENPEKKIFVDEDWKARVQAEKEAAAEPKPAGPSQADASAAQTAADDPKLPPASFEFLLESFAAQAMVALGLMPNPATNKVERRLNLARHMIDTLDLLQVKTAGNRTDSESRMLDALLHQLRLAYVTVSTGAEG